MNSETFIGQGVALGYTVNNHNQFACKCGWAMPILTDETALEHAADALKTLKDHRKTHDED